MKLQQYRILDVFLSSSNSKKIINVSSTEEVQKLINNFILNASKERLNKVFDVLGLKKSKLSRTKMIEMYNQSMKENVSTKKPIKRPPKIKIILYHYIAKFKIQLLDE